MKVRVVDAQTWTLATSVINSAHRRGMNPVEELNAHNLLATPELRSGIREEVLMTLLSRLYLARPGEMMRRSPNAASTPAEMYNIVIGYIEEFKILVEKEGS